MLFGRKRALLLFTVTILPCALCAADNDVAALQTRFDRENNSVRKAKLLERLGDAQFEQTRRLSQSNSFDKVGIVLEKYRDNVRAALNALKREHPDAERHTNGYKQLQMHIDKSLREVNDVLIISPPEFKPPLELVRQDLRSMDDELLTLLFPRRPLSKPKEHTAAGSKPPENQP